MFSDKTNLRMRSKFHQIHFYRSQFTLSLQPLKTKLNSREKLHLKALNYFITIVISK